MAARRHPPRTTTIERDGRTVAAVAMALTGDRWQVSLLSSAGTTLIGIGLLVKGEVILGGLTVAVFGGPT